MIIAVVVLVVALSASSAVVAGPIDGDQPPPDVLQRGLDTLKQLASGTNFKEFGFATAEEVKSATLGPSLPVLYVPFAELKRYTEGGDASKLVVDARRRVYEVVAGKDVRCAITFERTKKGWNSTRFGDPSFARLTEYARQGQVKSSDGDGQ